MRRRDADLLSQIEEAGLSDDARIAEALRKCVALGGRSGSAELRIWAQRELQGYPGDAELPAYRRIPAPLRIDGVQGNHIVGGSIITGQRISPRQLPDVVADDIDEEVALTQPIGEIERMALRAADEPIRLSPPMGADIVQLMNHQMEDPLTAIKDLYWAVSSSALAGVVDQVRTMLVALVAEIRAGLPADAVLPSSALTDQAVHVVVHGDKNRVLTTTAASAPGAESRATATGDAETSRIQRAAWWLVGAATIAGAVFAGWQALGM